MSIQENQLFVTSRPSRNKEVRGSGQLATARQTLELDWAERHGVDIEKLQPTMSMTDSTSSHTTQSPTWVGTPTENGNDLHSDQQTDSETSEISDDLKNDDWGVA
ncbi:MAG: hypothetical protein JO040_13650 [Gemmatimonadetes bacterium]|nr:hypothetical protein [Gemmatimonadota bacterium]